MIVAIGHKKQQGKDTAADAIYYHFWGRVHIYPFAGKLYKVCSEIDSRLNSRYYYDLHPKEKDMPWPDSNITPRDLLLKTGAFLRGLYGQEYFIDEKLLKEYSQSDDLLVIPDFRFKIEANALLKHDAFFMKIVRPSVTMAGDAADNDLDDWYGWDSIVINNGSVEDLKKKVCEIIEQRVFK